jgi:hypothetical protein
MNELANATLTAPTNGHGSNGFAPPLRVGSEAPAPSENEVPAVNVTASGKFAALAPVEPDDGSRIVKYAPVYLLFPEGKPNDAPPHPMGDHDYHPRAVELFLDDARLVKTRRWVLLFLVIYYVGYAALVIAAVLGRLEALDRNIVIPSELEIPLLVGFIALPYVASVFLTARSAKGVEPIRADLETHLEGGLANSTLQLEGGPVWPALWVLLSPLVRLVFPVVNAIAPTTAGVAVWKSYCEKIDSTNKYHHAVYANIAPGSRPADEVLQYWTFYLYNHWENEHPADWECVQLFFNRKSREPVAAAYSNHLGCLWRPWHKVRKLRDENGRETNHPLVYVARGSHANYFEPKDIGYEPPFAVPLPTMPGRFKPRLIGTRGANIGRQRDHVVLQESVAISQLTDRYQLHVAPKDLQAVDPFIPGHPHWNAWWWLTFRGKWAGGLQPIQGPAAQSRRWSQSFEWVRAEGQADDSWENAFQQVIKR